MTERRVHFEGWRAKVKAYLPGKNSAEAKRGSDELTAEDRMLRDLFYFSFKVSQGSLAAQRNIFRWLSAHDYLNDIPVPRAIPSYIKNIQPPRRHDKIPSDVSDAKNVYNDLRKISIGKEVAYDDDEDRTVPLVARIAENTISRDVDYQYKGRPRRVYDAPVKADSPQDPRASFLRRYVIQGKPSGTEAYDNLHKEMRVWLIAAIAQNTLSKVAGEDFRTLVTSWEKYHPGEQFLSEDVYQEIALARERSMPHNPVVKQEPEVGASTNERISEAESEHEVFGKLAIEEKGKAK